MKLNNINELISLYEKNKLSHIYLIETNNQNFCVENLLPLIKKLCFTNVSDEENKHISNLIDQKTFPNLYIISPDGKNIKKEQIKNLKKLCSVAPVLSKNHVYIIEFAEKLNSSSGNTLLKFAEEPVDNCYGFLLTNNKDNVISTIKSRCEIVSYNDYNITIYDKLNIDEKDYIMHKNNVLDYLKKIEVEKDDKILYNKLNLDVSYKEKENAIIFFNIMLDIYNNILKNKIKNLQGEYLFLQEFSIENIMKKRNIIVDIINNFNYNLNIDLIYDKFVIEMGDING